MTADIHVSTQGLRSIALLQGVAPHRLEALARECAWRRYEAGQPIISRNAKDTDVSLVISGRVRVTTYSAAGRQVTFHDDGAGTVLGDIAAVDDAPRSADVVALENVMIASLPAAAFKRLLREEPIVAERFMRHLTSMVRELSERVIELSTQGVQSRVHAELLRLARMAQVQGNVARIIPAPRHSDIASKVSTYREQVTRELSALNKAGVVARDAGSLVVKDLSRLEQLVEEGRS